MRPINQEQLGVEFPPLVLDTCTISPIVVLKTGTLVGIEERVVAGKFYEVLSIESAAGIGKIALPEGFVKSKGLAIGTLLGYIEADQSWINLGALLKNPEHSS